MLYKWMHDYDLVHKWMGKKLIYKRHLVIDKSTWINLIIIIINPLTARVVGAPQMILQPVFSIFHCSPLPSGTCRTPGLPIPWCCLPTSSFVRLVFFPLSLCLARWFWPGTWWTGDMTIILQSAPLSMVRRSSCISIAFWILARTSSLVTWSLYEMRSNLRQHLISMACMLL